jgi:hypothetical protein
MVVLVGFSRVATGAQVPGFQTTSPFAVQFVQAWSVPLPGNVKLIECKPLLNNSRNNLVMLVGGDNANDLRRTLLVTHWDGFRFAIDAQFKFLGWTVDPLLVGRFYDAPKIPPVAGSKAKPVVQPLRQVAVAAGIYQWAGGTFERVCPAPPALKVSINLPGTLCPLVGGVGDATQIWDVEQNQYRVSLFKLDDRDPGFPEWGLGNQIYEGRARFEPGVQYLQSYWNDTQRWVICDKLGTALTDPETGTTGDTIVVYVPKDSERKRTFWQLTMHQDYEQAWTSGVIPGKVLDVCIGDPRNDGTAGILVLTEDPASHLRTLLFYKPQKGLFRH